MIIIKKKFGFYNFAEHLQKARGTLVLRTSALLRRDYATDAADSSSSDSTSSIMYVHANTCIASQLWHRGSRQIDSHESASSSASFEG